MISVLYYTKPDHEAVIKIWNEMGSAQRNLERLLGEIPKGACPSLETPFDDDVLTKHFEFDDDMLTRRILFEKNCSCHLSPPCSNCLEHSELFPESW